MNIFFMIKAVVYDLDDTLFPEASFRESGFRFIAAYVQKNGFRISEKDIRAAYAEHPKKTFDMLVERYTLPFAASDLVDLYRTHPPRIQPYRGVREILEKLKKKYALGLITDHHAGMQRNKVAALALAAYFTRIIYSEDRGTSKPDPALFEEMKEYMRCKAGEIVYVGDNEQKDFVGARAAGYITVKYRSGGVYKDVVGSVEQKADYEIDDHAGIFQLLVSLSKEEKYV